MLLRSSTESELAEQKAKVLQLGGTVPEEVSAPPTERAPGGEDAPATVMVPRSLAATAGKLDKEGPSAAEIPSEVKQQYQVLISRLPQLHQAKLELLAKYMPKSKLVKANQEEIDDVTRQCRKLEKEFPNLPSVAGPLASGSGQSDLASETARLAGIQAKREALAAGLHDNQDRMKKLSQISPQMKHLIHQRFLTSARSNSRQRQSRSRRRETNLPWASPEAGWPWALFSLCSTSSS